MEKFKHTSSAPTTKSSKVILNSLENLKELSQSLSQEHRRSFAKKYGGILDLIFIPVETAALSALSQYWNPHLRCFELPNIDITPTIEEYACLLRLPMQINPVVYFHIGQYLTTTSIAELLGLPENDVNLTGHSNSRGLTRTFVESHLKKLRDRQDWETFERVLALAIYGLVLFPSALDMIDQAAMDVFFTVERNRNPVPAVLAETFLTLEFCQRHPKGKLRCCTHLLYVWVITHMYAKGHIQRHSDPLRGFHNIPIRQQNEQEWKNEFDKVERDSFKWVCPWYEGQQGQDIIYSCGDYPNVPLMGPRGCISYTPAIVLQQLCWMQTVPREEQLGGCCFRYEDGENTKLMAKGVRNAWKNVKMAGRAQLGRPILIIVSEYEAWRKSRGVPVNIPTENLKSESHSPLVTQMAEQLKVMEAQMKVVDQQKQDAELKILICQKRCKKLAKENEYLKDLCADISTTPRVTEKVSPNIMTRIQNLESKVRSLTEEKHQLRKEKHQLEEEVIQQGGIRKSLEAKVNRQKEVNGNLQKQICAQSRVTEELIQKVKELNILLAEIKKQCDLGWTSAKHYHDQVVRAMNAVKWWREEAREQGMDVDIWKKRYMSMNEELSHCIPNFVRRFEKAEKKIRVNPMLRLPPELEDFMQMCGGFARGLKRKRPKLLTLG